MTTRIQLLQSIDNLNIWKRGGERAPHKPLLLLLAIARLGPNHDQRLGFEEIEKPLKALLIDFGPARKSVHPEYPFWRLQYDDLWELRGADKVRLRQSNTDPPVTELRRHHVAGRFTADFAEALTDLQFREAVVLRILQQNFPQSYHADLLATVGLEISHELAVTRDPAFRDEVLDAYAHRCAICGYDGRLGRSDLGLEAAHIRWVQASGPSIVPNGIALCALHHRIFDRGGIGLREDLHILVSGSVHGGPTIEGAILRHHRQPLGAPHSKSLAPDAEYVKWHRTTVFKAPARE